jgi:anti-sigma regulatory factor (Ser/Thr protein kinase)
MRMTLPARLEAVERFCVDLRFMLQPWVPDSERFAVEMLLREALTNAVMHGCGADGEGRVHCEIAALEGGMRIRVADDGEGFDWRKQSSSEPEPPGEASGGLSILHSCANRVLFSDNGNEVEVVHVFGQAKRGGTT